MSPWSADYTHAKQKILGCPGCSPLRLQTATCGPAANACERVLTNYSEVTIDGDYYYPYTYHCGYDDVNGTRHKVAGNPVLYFDCSSYDLELHEHYLQFR